MESAIHDFLAAYPNEVFELALHTFNRVQNTIPGIHAGLDVPAKLVSFGFGPRYADTICTLIPSQKGVKLGFYKGTELADPGGLLEGSGKVHKYVAVKSVAIAKSAALGQLLKEAYAKYQQRKNI